MFFDVFVFLVLLLPQITSHTNTEQLVNLPTPQASPIAEAPVVLAVMETPSPPTPTPLKQTSNMLTPKPAQNSPDILAQINEFRSANGVSTVSQSPEVCDFANLRAKEISGGFNHEGFRSRISSGSIPFTYTKVIENIATTVEPSRVFDIWRNSAVHRQNMLSDITLACVGKYGNFYVYIGMKP